MNNVSLTGRITKDPEVFYTANNTAYTNFSLAVDRKYSNANGEKVTDFISCVAWNKQAEFIGKYVKKGNLLEITGSIQNDTYQTQTGENRTVARIHVDSVSNLTPKPKDEPTPQQFNPNYSHQQPTNNNHNQFNDDLPF